MPTTSNFGWTTPADTDLVKDGALAIRTLGNGVDASLVDLKGGTTGQVLSKATNTDLDYTWITPNVGDITEVQAGTGISVASGTGPIPVVTNTVATAFDAAGDLVYGTGADTFTKLSLGTAGQVLKVNSGATAPEWGAAAAGAYTLIARTSFTNVASQNFDNFSTTYNSYMVVIESLWNVNQNDADLRLTMRYSTTDGSAHYGGATKNAYNAATWTNTSTATSSNYVTISTDCGVSSNPNIGVIYFTNGFQNANQDAQFFGTFIDVNNGAQTMFFGVNLSNQQYTGFKLAASTQNIDGTVAIYGLAKA
jgi:hypothetical protein